MPYGQAMRSTVLVVCVFSASVAHAWGPAGHQTVGAIADKLIVGTNAAKAVKRILGTQKLQTAALWADCAKGVTETPPYHYVVSTRFPECVPFQTAAGKRAMVNYVMRNVDACHPTAREEVCHKQYHYADVAIERDSYVRTDVGTSDHDVVSAIGAAIKVLQGGMAPPPFSFTSMKEALRVLAHYVGDVHQPLHVGAIYLDTAGHEVDPDIAGLDPSTITQGGNRLIDGGIKLHSEWDAIPANLSVSHFKSTGAAQAKLVPVTPGLVFDWPAAWATDTVLASHTAFQGLAFGRRTWSRLCGRCRNRRGMWRPRRPCRSGNW